MKASFVGIVAMVAIGLASPAIAIANDIASIVTNERPAENFKIIGISDLARMTANPKSGANVYDANGPSLRDSVGVVPGANLLSSSDKYDVATTLPADKHAKLVFYCADLH